MIIWHMTFVTHPNNTTKYNSKLYQINMTILQEIMYLKDLKKSLFQWNKILLKNYK